MPDQQPLHELVVLYDADCPLCRWVRGWLERTPQLVPLRWVPCGSPQARRLLPWLDHDRACSEVTVVGSGGQVWTAGDAWIACLWATADHRGLAQRLATPAMRPRARAVALAVAATMQGTRPPPACAVPDAATGAAGGDYGGRRACQR